MKKRFVVNTIVNNESGSQSVELFSTWNSDNKNVTPNGVIKLILNEEKDYDRFVVGSQVFVEFSN